MRQGLAGDLAEQHIPAVQNSQDQSGTHLLATEIRKKGTARSPHRPLQVLPCLVLLGRGPIRTPRRLCQRKQGILPFSSGRLLAFQELQKIPNLAPDFLRGAFDFRKQGLRAHRCFLNASRHGFPAEFEPANISCRPAAMQSPLPHGSAGVFLGSRAPGERALARYSGTPTSPLASLGMFLRPRRTSAFLKKALLFRAGARPRAGTNTRRENRFEGFPFFV
jgi:hypothetical protein